MKRERKEEPNSGLGGAISYMLNHWSELTKFMHVAGAPLDNNICERSIKSSIRHRKNSLFYKTQHGALIGDMFMSLIQTCKDMKLNPFEYLLEIQRNKSEVFKYPDKWLPWNYSEQLYC
ncbi:MAG: transposase [Bacteriovoracaceae bacterium]|nr:transposase [Bacteriovoracaceae bacterium]